MRAVRLLLAAVLAVGALAAAAPASSADTVHYYVALGDSLSVGYQPGLGDTDQGYSDDVYAALKLKDPSLQLVKLGCSGETTATMINGGKCTDRYPVGTSQLSVAEQFFAAHPGQTKYVTIDIGANDVDGCAPGGTIDPVCVVQGVVTITQNLNTIMARLKAATKDVPYTSGMNYYDPFLEYWLNGLQGQLISQASVALLIGVNTVESVLYQLYGYKVADVQTAYNTLNVLNFDNVPPYGKLPRNVATICQLTYMCSVQNIHPNPTGYQVIADAFLKRLS